MERDLTVHIPYLHGFHKDLGHMKREAYKHKVDGLLKRPAELCLSNGLIFYPKLKLTSTTKVKQLAQAQKNRLKGKTVESNLVKHDMATSDEHSPDLAMGQTLHLPLSERLHLSLCTQIRQQNNWTNAYVQPSLSYRADHGVVCQASLLSGDHSQMRLHMQKAMGRGIIMGFGYQAGLKQVALSQEAFHLYLQRHNLCGLFCLGDQGYVSMSYQRSYGQLAFKSSCSVQPSRHYQTHASVSVPLPGHKKVSVSVTKSGFMSRLRVSLQRRLTSALKVFFCLDSYDTHNVVLFFGLKYKHNLLALPLFSSQSGSLLCLNNIKPLLLTAFLLGMAERTFLRHTYFQPLDQEKNEEQVQEQALSREDQMKLIEERARENHERERACNGLVILEAYYGESELIEQLSTQQNKAAWLFRNKVPGDRLLDVTMALRFQVQNSSLFLRREDKSYLVGVGTLNTPENRLFIQYSKNGQNRTVVLLNREGLQL